MPDTRQIVITQRVSAAVAQALIKGNDELERIILDHASVQAERFMAARHLPFHSLLAHQPGVVLREYDDHGYAIEPYWLAVVRVTATLIKPVDN